MTSGDTVSAKNPGKPIELAKETDVRNLFLLALGRPAESAETVAGFEGKALSHVTKIFFRCAEFDERLVGPVAAGQRLPRPANTGPGPDLVEWAGQRLPLSKAGAKRVAASRTWDDLFVALLSDAVFGRAIGADAPALEPRIVNRIMAGAALKGAVEALDGDWLRGWALRTDRLDQPLPIEIWANGALVMAAEAGLFRRDVQDRHGGPGLAGIELQLPEGFDGGFRTIQIELRDRASGLIIDKARIVRAAPPPDVAASLRAELAQISGLLKSIEARLPHLDRGQSIPLADYSNYAENWRPRAASTRSGEADQAIGAPALGVVIDGVGRPAPWIEDCVTSLVDQTGGAPAMALVLAPSMSAYGADLTHRAGWCGASLTVIESDAECAADRYLQGLDALPEPVDFLLLTGAEAVVAPDAAGALAKVFADEAETQAVYTDSDLFDPADANTGFRLRRRIEPQLRSAFDLDLLAQIPFVGGQLAFRRQALKDLGLHPEAEGMCLQDALLRLGGKGGAVRHLDRILTTSHRQAGPSSDLWARCVMAALAEQGLQASVEPHTDILGARVEGALRVRRPVDGSRTACVIVPTRDALDMLRPCLDSLIAHRPDNRTQMEILVIDHASEDAETLAYLDGLKAAGEIRVMAYAGEFNWALMNNLAAQTSEADVLVFLNNDTVVVSPDWLDELVSQALRPEVGAVGVRLIYEDGTIQHAGFVTRDADYMFLVHEGVGRPGSDAGYLGRHSLLRAVSLVTGACLAVSRETFQRLGGFDSANFPVEANDADFCLRARAEGLTVLYDPYVTLFHYESKTRGFSFDGERKRVAQAASALMWARWGEQFGRDPYYNSHFDRESKPFTRLRPPRIEAG
jgi:GT2 family glycosyltransferase